jgi:hypothetical protein
VVELVDTLCSGRSVLTGVGVQIPPSAFIFFIIKQIIRVLVLTGLKSSLKIGSMMPGLTAIGTLPEYISLFKE